MNSILGLDFVEMDRNQEQAFYYGAGGGVKEEGDRVNHMRTRPVTRNRRRYSGSVMSILYSDVKRRHYGAGCIRR